MPEEEFKGVLAGGIRIKEVISEEEQTQSAEQGLGIRNAFSYVIGVVVSNNRSATDPGLELLDVFADQVRQFYMKQVNQRCKWLLIHICISQFP